MVCFPRGKVFAASACILAVISLFALGRHEANAVPVNCVKPCPCKDVNFWNVPPNGPFFGVYVTNMAPALATQAIPAPNTDAGCLNLNPLRTGQTVDRWIIAHGNYACGGAGSGFDSSMLSELLWNGNPGTVPNTVVNINQTSCQ